MSKNEKARPTGGTAERAAAEMTACRASIPMSDCNTAAAGRQRKVSDLLNRGRENAVPLRHLEKMANMPGRVVRRMIEAERRSGTVIASDNQHGYWLTDDPAEAERFSRSMEHRAREILRTARAIKEAAGID